jgi:hypothetical protein
MLLTGATMPPNFERQKVTSNIAKQHWVFLLAVFKDFFEFFEKYKENAPLQADTVHESFRWKCRAHRTFLASVNA